MWKLWILTCLAALAICKGQTIARQQCTADRMMHTVEADGNVLIGGVMDIRGGGQNGIGCGLPESDMMQVYEASTYAINFLNDFNNGAGYISGVTFGMKTYDTCSSTSTALTALQKLYPQTTSADAYCVPSNQVMAGIVGPLFSSTALPVAEMAGQIPVSVISPSAMSPALSDKFQYPTFLRTVPSTVLYAKAVVEVLKQLQWQSILVVYADDAYGRSGYEQLLQAAHNVGICVTTAIAVKSVNDKEGYKTELQAILASSFTPAVMIAGNAQTKVLLEAVHEVPGAANVQWILSDLDISQPSSIANYPRARGAILITVKSPTLTEFRDHFTTLEADPLSVENPWFETWYEKVYNCKFTGAVTNRCPTRTLADLRSQFVQHPFVVPAIKAIFAYAEAVRSICQGTGFCSQLRNMNPSTFHNQLKNLDFTFPNNFAISGLAGQRIKFDANGDPEISQYTIYNYNNAQGSFRFEEIGSFDANGLTMSKNPTLYDSTRTTALASIPTVTCQEKGLLPQRSVQFRYSGNDIVIAALVNGHSSGQGAFTCGDGITSRLASLVAAEWAVSQYRTVRNPNGIGPSLGSLVADVCPPDSGVAGSFISDLLSGNNRLVDSTGSVISSSNIHAFVTQTESEQAELVSPILSKYMIPEVQTSATTPMIGNNAMSAYFSRAIPNDEVFYTALTNLLLKLNWKYVQVATHSMGRYQHMTQTFIKIAAEHGICVVNIADNLDNGQANRYEQALSHLNAKSTSRVVVIIGDKDDVRGLLTAKNNQGLVNTLQFIAGTDRWARDPEYIEGLESAAAGSVVVDLELTENSDFANWLSTRSLTQIASNQFLRELFEMTQECSVDASSKGVYSRTCTSSDAGNNFRVYQGKAPYVISSVYTVADKLNEIFLELCPNAATLCSNFMSAKDIGMRLDQKLQNVARTSAGYGIKDGEGITNYRFYQYTQSTWRRIADFNTENKMLMNQNLPTSSMISTCPDACMECQYMFAMQDGLFLSGDWLIGGSFSVSSPGPEDTQPYMCGSDISGTGAQYTTAMMYALQQINNGQAPVSVNGIKLGGLALDHCNAERRANLMVSNVFSGLDKHMGVDQSRILAWMTDNTMSTNEAAELLDPLGVAMVSPSATGVNLLEYPNFYRTIQGDATTALALTKIIQYLGYEYIQVAYSADAYGRGGLDTMMNVAQAEGICITNSMELMGTANASSAVTALLTSGTDVVVLYMGSSATRAMLNAIANNPTARSRLLILMPQPHLETVNNIRSSFAKPIISLQLEMFDLTGYQNYINSSPITNPYFARYYMETMNCNLPGYSSKTTACPMPLTRITANPNYQQSNFVLSTINAVYSVVDALDRTLMDYCGPDYTQPCANFLASTDKRRRFNQYLNRANFIDEGQNNFRFLAREGNMAYQVLQSTTVSNQVYRTVGTYRGVSLDLNLDRTSYSDVASTCRAPCLSCIMRGLNFTHTPGDIYLAGMFDVHARSLSPFTCGEIQTLHGFLLLEAFHYALEKVNSKEGQFANILPGVTLGGVGLDACGSEVRGGYLVSNINNGVFNLTKNGERIDPTEIDAYIGSYGSTSSLYLARILTDLQIPQISYASASQELSDTRVYPYFYRTVPSDDRQVEAMLKLLDRLDIRYVQVLYEDNSFGTTAKDTFVARAANYRICVAQTVDYPDIGVVSRENANAAVAKLIKKPAANTVVTFVGTAYINSLLMAVERSARAKDKLRFVGSDAWADNQDAIFRAESQAVDSITLKLDSDDVEDFERYINAMTLANSLDNPWFEEYYQEIHNCYTSASNTMGYPSQCTTTPLSNIVSQGYQQDPGVVYVINAVYAAAFGIHETLKNKCGNYTAVCQAYRSQSNRRDVLRDKLADVKFNDTVGNPFMFLNRSGVAGYRINSIDRGDLGGYIYNPIGSYDAVSRTLRITQDYHDRRSSGCERVDACAECPAIRDAGVRYVYLKDTTAFRDDAPYIVAFFDIHEQGVDPYRCGKINIPGFQQFLSFIYAMEIVLKESNGKSRVLVIDTCSNSLRVDQDLYGLLNGTGLCNTLFDQAHPISEKNLGSVVTAGNLNTMAASRVLELPRITYVSPNALSTHLDDKQHLVRTIAPISAMMKKLVEFLQNLGWSYGDVIYQNSAEGIYPWQRLNYYAYQKVCLAGAPLNFDGEDNDIDTAVEQVLGGLNYQQGSRAVILLGTHDFVKRILTQAYDLGILKDYTWVLGVEWDVTEETLMSAVPAGADVRILSISRIQDTVVSFNTYVNAISRRAIQDSNSQYSIPPTWFDEFYEAVFACSIQGEGNMPVCNTDKTFREATWTQNKYVLNTVAAAYATGMGLSKFITNNPSMTNQLNTPDHREEIRQAILDVERNLEQNPGGIELATLKNLMLRFDKENRWWDHEFMVYHWQNKNGVWDHDMLTHGNTTEMNNFKANFTVSKCIQSVAAGACGCSHVAETPQAQRRSGPSFVPGDHRNYYKYDSNNEQRYDWPVWAIVMAVLTGIGLVVVIILFLILLIAYPIRGGTSVLGYLSIIGIVAIYAINFAFFIHATDATCGIRRFLMGVVYMIALAPLLIKAIDNWRFSRMEYEQYDKYSGLSSAAVLLFSALGLVLIQCIIPIIWLILVHPTASLWPVNDYRHDNWWCDPPDDYDLGLVLSFCFVVFILLVTSVFCALAFDTDRNNYESRWILFGCIATAGCFLVWMIVTTNAGPPFRDPAVAIANFVNASLLGIALPLRKTILLFRAKSEDEDQKNAMEVLNGRGGAPYNEYDNSFMNPSFELTDYDNQYIDSKPSEF